MVYNFVNCLASHPPLFWNGWYLRVCLSPFQYLCAAFLYSTELAMEMSMLATLTDYSSTIPGNN